MRSRDRSRDHNIIASLNKLNTIYKFITITLQYFCKSLYTNIAYKSIKQNITHYYYSSIYNDLGQKFELHKESIQYFGQ